MRRGRGSYVNPNQEMVGLGVANLAAGFFQGFPISSSSSRTPVAEAAGARTQLTGVVGALAVALLLLVAPDLLRNLPTSALAAVVIAAAIGLIEVTDLRRIYRIQRWEFWLSICCLIGVAVLGAIPGIGLAIVIAVIEFLWDGWRPHSAVLGRADGRQGLPRHQPLSRGAPDPGPGAVPLGCAAVLCQRRAVPRSRARRGRRIASRRCAGWSWRPSRSRAWTSPPRTCWPSWTRPCSAAGIELCFAEMKDPVKDKLKRFGLFAPPGRGALFSDHGRRRQRYLSTHRRRLGGLGRIPLGRPQREDVALPGLQVQVQPPGAEVVALAFVAHGAQQIQQLPLPAVQFREGQFHVALA